MNEKVILIGSGQHCNVVIYNLKMQNKYVISCIAEVDENKAGKYHNDIYVEHFINFSIESMKYLENKYQTNLFFIAFGAMKYRKPVFDFLTKNGWNAVNIIHPNAVVSDDATLGTGILIEAGCLVTPNPVIGNNVVVNTGSQVNHDNIVEDHVYIASGVILSGGITIKENSLIDDGVIVTLGTKIGKNCIIGAGAVVTKDIPDNSIAYGSPCKVVRENQV